MTVSTTNPTQSLPIRKAPLFTPYVVVWSMFGALSFGFLMVLGLAPEWLDDLRPAAVFSDAQSIHVQRASRLAAEIGELKDSVAHVQLELSKMRTDVSAQTAEHKAVADQLTSLEARISNALPAAALDTSSTPTTPPAAAPVPAENTAREKSEAGKSPVRTLKVINADPSTTNGTMLETGSVSGQAAKVQIKPATSVKQPAAFDTAIVKTAKPQLGVKISTGASIDSLRLSWNLLADKHGDALDKLQARYTTGGDSFNPTYELVAGPIATKADAAKVCKTLSERGVTCTVSGFQGEAL